MVRDLDRRSDRFADLDDRSRPGQRNAMVGRVVLGTDTVTSLSYAAALAVAVWAAFGSRWRLMTLASLAGGAA